jgi:hypothetical protein
MRRFEPVGGGDVDDGRLTRDDDLLGHGDFRMFRVAVPPSST